MSLDQVTPASRPGGDRARRQRSGSRGDLVDRHDPAAAAQRVGEALACGRGPRARRGVALLPRTASAPACVRVAAARRAVSGAPGRPTQELRPARCHQHRHTPCRRPSHRCSDTRAAEPRHERREIVRQAAHAQAQRAPERRGERIHAAGAARRGPHRRRARKASWIADDERLLRPQRPAVQRQRDRYHVPLAAQYEHRAVVQGKHERPLCKLYCALVGPPEDPREECPHLVAGQHASRSPPPLGERLELLARVPGGPHGEFGSLDQVFDLARTPARHRSQSTSEAARGRGRRRPAGHGGGPTRAELMPSASAIGAAGQRRLRPCSASSARARGTTTGRRRSRPRAAPARPRAHGTTAVSRSAAHAGSRRSAPIARDHRRVRPVGADRDRVHARDHRRVR